MNRDYQAVLVVQPDLTEEALSKLKAQLGEAISRQGGRLLEEISLGKRRLGGRIKRFRDGIFLQIRLDLPSSEVAGLCKSASLLPPVLRFMVLKGDGSALEPPQKASEYSSHRSSFDEEA